MIMVPIRIVEKTDDGVVCRLGSEPGEDAPIETIPSDCILKLVASEGSDLGVVMINPEKAPEGIRKALGLT